MRTPQLRRTRIAPLLPALVIAFTACGGGSTAGTSDLHIVATTNVLADVVRGIAGDDVRITSLIPAGADPHDYAASSAQLSDLQSADLVVANGLHLEEGLEDALEQARADGANILEVAPLLDPIPFGGSSNHEDDAHEDDAHEDESSDDRGDLDPHVWLDPIRMTDAVTAIGDALDAIDPDDGWVNRASSYSEQLLSAHEEIMTILDVVPAERRVLVTNHDALGYFADRYGFEVLGTVIPGGATLADPSSADLAELVATIQREEVPAIFAETIEPSVLAETVAAEVGDQVRVVELFTGSLGEEGSGAETLIDALIINARRIAEALG